MFVSKAMSGPSFFLFSSVLEQKVLGFWTWSQLGVIGRWDLVEGHQIIFGGVPLKGILVP